MSVVLWAHTVIDVPVLSGSEAACFFLYQYVLMVTSKAIMLVYIAVL